MNTKRTDRDHLQPVRPDRFGRVCHLIRRTANVAATAWLWTACLVTYGGFEIPGEPSAVPIILEHATVHTVSGELLPDGVLVIEDGKIAQLGRFGSVSRDDGPDVNRIDLTGKHIYPGLIDADTSLGLIEIDSVKGTNDKRETGSVNPNVRGAIAFDPDSEMIPVARAGGVLHALTHPNGGLFGGQSSLMQLDGWSAVEMTVVPHVGTHVNWPRSLRLRGPSDESAAEHLKERKERLVKISEELDNARAYEQTRTTNPEAPFDARLNSLLPLLHREVPMMVHTNGLAEIQEAVAFANRNQLRLVIVGGYDAPKCAELLNRYRVPVIVTGTQRLPQQRHADYDEPFRIPAELHAASVDYCLAGLSRFSASLVQNLSDHAGTAAAHGLDRQEAVRAITLNAAKILGVDDRLGSLEAGKDATLIVTDGDILEVTTHVELAWLAGRPVDLNNRHKRLWAKYRTKYERLRNDQSPSSAE